MLCLDEKVEKINLFWYGKHQSKIVKCIVENI